MCVVELLPIYNISELLDGVTMSLDEGNGDGDCGEVAFYNLDGARRISSFGESVANLFAESFIFGKVNVFTPSDVVGVDEERLEFVR